MQRLGMPMSNDTHLRVLKRDVQGESQAARGRRYGTIVVDLEIHAVIDVPRDRSVESEANWPRDLLFHLFERG